MRKPYQRAPVRKLPKQGGKGGASGPASPFLKRVGGYR